MLHMDFKNLLLKYNKTKRDGIIHIGAHLGEEIDFYKELGFTKILLFEPQHKPFEKIPSSKGVYKVNAAVGSVNKKVKMYVAQNGESSSILKPQHHLIAHPDVLFLDEQEEVDLVTLDDWFANNTMNLSADDFSYLVMDAQGYEGKIVEGAKEILKRMEVVYSEVSVNNLYEENTLMDYLDSQLKIFGLHRKEHWISFSGGGEAIYIKTHNKTYDYKFENYEDYTLGSLVSKRLGDKFILQGIENFVETGTYLGDGIRWALDGRGKLFKKIYSVEYAAGLANHAKMLFGKFPFVHIEQGHSPEFLASIVPLLKTPTLFYLDAHETGGHGAAWKENNPCPLVDEFKIILEQFYDINEAIIIADDERYLTGSVAGYPDVNTLKDMCKNKGLSSCYFNDSAIFCHPKWIKTAQEPR